MPQKLVKTNLRGWLELDSLRAYRVVVVGLLLALSYFQDLASGDVVGAGLVSCLIRDRCANRRFPPSTC